MIEDLKNTLRSENFLSSMDYEALVNPIDAVALAVQFRDRGDTDIAERLLETIVRLDPELANAWIERLVIAYDIKHDFPQLENILSSSPNSVKETIEYKLLDSAYSLSVGKFKTALETMNLVRYDQISTPFFRNIHQRCMLDLAELMTRKISSGTENHVAYSPLAQASELNLTGTVEILKHAILRMDLATFYDWLPAYAFHRGIDPTVLRLALAAPLPELSEDHKLLGFAFLGALRAETDINQLLSQAHASYWNTSPLFLKWCVHINGLVGSHMFPDAEHRLEEFIRGEIFSTTEWQWFRSEVQRREIEGRILTKFRAIDTEYMKRGVLPPTRTKANVDLQGKTHIFIGYFGQLRFPSEILPRLNKFIKQEIHKNFGDNTLISVAVGTWSNSGVRTSYKTDIIDFVNQRLPVEIISLNTSLAFRTVGDFAVAMPRLWHRVNESASNHSSVNAELIRTLLGQDTHCEVSEDTDYLSDVGMYLKNRFGTNNTALNQGRMWSRIAALGRLRTNCELTIGVPITVGLLLRSDLIFRSGDLGQQISEVNARCSENIVTLDYDPHANFWEGLGDRYMIASPAAIDRLFDGERLIKSIVQPESKVDTNYQQRLFGHEFLNTILFEHNTKVKQIGHNEIPFDIYRGRLTLESLVSEVQQDAMHSPLHTVRESLTALLNSQGPIRS